MNEYNIQYVSHISITNINMFQNYDKRNIYYIINIVCISCVIYYVY